MDENLKKINKEFIENYKDLNEIFFEENFNEFREDHLKLEELETDLNDSNKESVELRQKLEAEGF